MKITIPEYTVVMTIGPSNCGKSYLMENTLIPFFDNLGVRSHYLSSDNLRRKLIGENLHKHDDRMMGVSSQAFNLLHNELEVYTSYPVNVPVVMVDATNLSKIARGRIIELAKKNGYSIVGLVFDYDNKDDYFQYAEGMNKRVIFDMVQTMKKVTLKEIDKKDFTHFVRIPSNDFTQLEFEYKGTELTTNWIPGNNFCVVGDIHGCYDELLEMLQDRKGIRLVDDGTGIPLMEECLSPETGDTYIHHVLIGDLVDKGPKVREVIEFVYKNRAFFTIVKGNHESWNYNYLKRNIKPNAENDRLIENFFDSVRLFESDEDLRNKFFELFEQEMHTFVRSQNLKVIVTHAPCESRYLGKMDKVAAKKQNHIMYPKKADFPTEDAYMDAYEEFFSFLQRDSEIHHPIHVFGHVMLATVFQNKNKYGIDLGCVAGGALATLMFIEGNRKPFVRKYASQQPAKEVLRPMFRVRTNEVDLHALDRPVYNRLKWAAKNKVNFISGTMSPCDKHLGENDLESLKKGILYYKGKGVGRMILQPKFMGSRCNLLLHKSDIDKCKAFSRNGFEIDTKRIHSNGTMENLFETLIAKYAELFETGLEYILFDGELLPWNVMGKELIERDFVLASKACHSELDILEDTGFEQLFAKTDFYLTNSDENLLKPHELGMKKSLDGFRDDILHTDTMAEVLKKYDHQLEVFGGDADLEFKPFAILKMIHSDGSQTNCINSGFSNIEMFRKISMENYLVIDLESELYQIYIGNLMQKDFETVEEACDFFWDFVTKQREMEGVVIKPDQAYLPGVAPYLKCRNKEYLRIVYGFDYDVLPVKTARLLENKSIKRKVETSIKEYELGRMLLDIPMNEISLENTKWVSLTLQLFKEQEGEKELDPRL